MQYLTVELDCTDDRCGGYKFLTWFGTDKSEQYCKYFLGVPLKQNKKGLAIRRPVCIAACKKHEVKVE